MAEKLCVVCGTDVAASPRVKDQQGRYQCKPCFEARQPEGKGSEGKAGAKSGAKGAAMSPVAAATAVKLGPAPKTAAVKAPAQTAPEEDAILAALVEDSVQKTVYCPNCSAPMKAGSVLCTGCGFNTESQQSLKTKVQRAPREKGGKGESGRRRVRMTMGFPPWLHMILAGGALAGLFAMAMNDEDSLIMFAGISSLYYLGMYILMIFFAFKDEMGRWGLWGVIGFFTGIGQLLIIVPTLLMSERGNMKVGALMCVLIIMANLILKVQAAS